MSADKIWRLACGHASHEYWAGLQSNHHPYLDLSAPKQVRSHRIALITKASVDFFSNLPTPLAVLQDALLARTSEQHPLQHAKT
jgi:hypothetical protein